VKQTLLIYFVKIAHVYQTDNLKEDADPLSHEHTFPQVINL